MKKTYTLKQFKYKDKTYKFKEPLKIIIDNYIAYDLKTIYSELTIPIINDGYSGKLITKPDKTIREYLTYVFDNYLVKKDNELSKDDNSFKNQWLNLIDLSKTK